jgi:hypothetical protein
LDESSPAGNGINEACQKSKTTQESYVQNSGALTVF